MATKRRARRAKPPAPASKPTAASPAARRGDAGISDDAVQAATGKVWSQWFSLLDRWGAKTKRHPEIARYLSKEHGVRSWWSQMVTVQYERARGLRDVGQTTAGWQAQAQKTIFAKPAAVWEELERACGRWLVKDATLEEGARFGLRDGTEIEVRAVRAPKLMRLGWQPKRGPKSTVELTLLPSDGRTILHIQHRGLPGKAERDAMARRWKSAVERVAAAL